MNKKTMVATAVLSLIFEQSVYASQISNQISGVGPSDSLIKPVLCLQDSAEVVRANCAVAPGKSIDARLCTDNKYYVGGALRFLGNDKDSEGKDIPCSKKNIYLGYLGFRMTDDKPVVEFQEYQVPPGIHMTIKDPSVNSHGELKGEIIYTPIESNFNLPKARGMEKTPYWDAVGVNLSGLEFSNAINPYTIPNLSLVDSQDEKSKVNSDLKEMTAFIQAGMNLVRVPISWGFLQLEGPGTGALNLGYFNSYVKPILASLTHAGVYTIVDLHAYMRYSKFGKEISGCYPGVAKCPDGSVLTDAKAFEDVWLKLFELIKKDKDIDMNYLMFDLMNEPTYDKAEDRDQVPGDFVFNVQVGVIKVLRNAGFAGSILVEGSKWSGLHSWDQTWISKKDGKTYSNATLFSRENFAKAGITDLSKIIINAHQYLDTDFSGTHTDCRQDLQSTGIDGFNLQAFADWLKANKMKAMVTEFGTGTNATSCGPALNGFLNYLKENAVKDNKGNDKGYGFSGWTIWSAGHGWGNDYVLRVKPDSYQMDVVKGYLSS